MKKFLKFILIGMSVLFLVSCGKPDSQKAFENSFNTLATELEKKIPDDDPVSKSFAKAIKKATYKINKVTENGESADIDVTNLPAYMGELISSIMPLAMSGAPDAALDAAATKFFDDLLKSKDLSYVEKNLIVKMQKIDGEWKIENGTEVIGAALGGLDELFKDDETENNSN